MNAQSSNADAAATTARTPEPLFGGSTGRRITVRDLAAAKAVGKNIAERAKAKGIEKVVFDRGGYIYHGRVKALADSAREAGLQF